MEILIKRLNEQAKLPVYSQEAGPGMDLYSLGEVTIAPGAKVVVSTGIAMAMPVGYVGLIWNYNSIVIDGDLRVTAGLVDSGYREEVAVEVYNTGGEERTIAAGSEIAQLLVQEVGHAHIIEAEDLSGSMAE